MPCNKKEAIQTLCRVFIMIRKKRMRAGRRSYSNVLGNINEKIREYTFLLGRNSRISVLRSKNFILIIN